MNSKEKTVRFAIDTFSTGCVWGVAALSLAPLTPVQMLVSVTISIITAYSVIWFVSYKEEF